ncbi:uncharacterized protein LOC143905241 [Temnothorax americanus]|uniref:uncharacterized protein LOC143905241 n=1 Tax=Temnothorax americanus TaxID=1964332 RepID=UPI004067E99A
MKAFAIIEDDDGKRVVPSKWLSDDFKTLQWPPFDDSDKIRRAVINQHDPTEDWEVYPVIRFIKSNDNYINAVSELKTYVDKVSDMSDREKLKRTRFLRKKRKLSDEFCTEDNNRFNKRNKSKWNNIPSDDESEDSREYNKLSKNETDSNIYPDVPSSLSIVNEDKQREDLSNDDFTNEDIIDKKKAANSLSQLQQESQNTSSTDNETVKQSITANTAKKHAKPVIIDNFEIQTPTTSQEFLFNIYGMQKKMLTIMNGLSKKQDIMIAKIGLMEKNGIKHGHNNVIDAAVIETMTKYFPINDENKTFAAVEEKLKMERKFFNDVVLYMKSKGGNTSHDLIYNILSSIITNSAASNYSFYGQKHKKIFSDLALCSCVYHGVKLQFPDVSEKDIKHSIKRWLDSSRTRLLRAKTQAQKRKIFQPIVPPDENVDDPDEV